MSTFKKGDRARVVTLDASDKQHMPGLVVGSAGEVMENHTHSPYVRFDDVTPEGGCGGRDGFGGCWSMTTDQLEAE
jgi:hypothetical protein